MAERIRQSAGGKIRDWLEEHCLTEDGQAVALGFIFVVKTKQVLASMTDGYFAGSAKSPARFRHIEWT